MTSKFQRAYSLFNDEIFIVERRQEVANQIVSVLRTHLKRKQLSELSCLEVGTSGGYMASTFAKNFRTVVGIDIDKNASKRWKKHKRRNLRFMRMDAQHMMFGEDTFDVIITNQDYEFLENAQKLIREIYRVQKPGGICFFGARNKLTLIEGQYRIPFLALLPERWAESILKMLGEENIFVARYKTYWELKRMCKQFYITDYSVAIIKNPRRFGYKKLLRYKKYADLLPEELLGIFRFLLPNFVWVLQKPRG